MDQQRVLLVQEAGPIRRAVARALASAGHEVRVAEGRAGSRSEPGVDAVVYDERFSTTVADARQRIAVRRPVNMEELRRALREGR